MIGDMVQKVVIPIASKLWQGIGEDQLDEHTAFTVEYARGKDEGMPEHLDDAEITVNYCLGNDFEGGDLKFGRMRCPQHEKLQPDAAGATGAEYTYQHVPGRAVIHLGSHAHTTEDVVSGERFNIVIHCRSRAWRRSIIDQ